MSPKISLYGISQIDCSISNKMCVATYHYAILFIIKREIGNAFSLVGWDGAPVENIYEPKATWKTRGDIKKSLFQTKILE